MSSRAARRSYRPLLPLSLSLSYALHGLHVRGYHLLNLVAHLLAATVFYLAFARLLAFVAREERPRARDRLLAALAAAIFVVHPISGMSVNYLTRPKTS